MGIKDKLIAAGAEKFLQSYLEDLGELKDFSIDTKNKNISLTVSLVGEPENFKTNIQGYNIIESGDRTFVSFDKITFSKEWMNIALRKYLPVNKIEVPDKYRWALKYIS